ncbi:thioredoxin domain-containing protein [Sulfodiicoccus acidiphilus]|uniref:Thioredoxin domain-containing protein n=1 Tax=Sulfodiicoccus acidiphilus TaxID=1670455 RepID=A0A348B6T9_9CREN|nr:thioredoxin domain-containing protein [Sulfodiicoccus acidiphilus]GGT96061.1 thioredoxin domain-containing protein [Sulfodiicoccus acidiphilus]
MNRLANATSTYLRESADQPVDWHTWSEEAFRKAKEEDKPILVDVGASWCHWCHVMDQQNYSDPEVARILNEYFIPIKVDRDEMPDVDRKLQQAVSAMTGEGGWPLTAFLTPEGKVFFGGTYFPPEDMYGKVGFKRLLWQIVKIWKEEREKLNVAANTVVRFLAESREVEELEPTPEVVDQVINFIISNFDLEEGGLGNGMKFPHPTVDELLLSQWFRTRDNSYRKLVSFTLTKMYFGGIFDQVGGGFHRYSVDREWWVPHFEKLGVDNAELLLDYFSAYLETKDPEFLDCISMTSSFLLRDMKVEGGFANSLDADSEGVEGKYYTWTEGELQEALGDDFQLGIWLFSFRASPEVEGRKVLKRSASLYELTRRLSTDQFEAQKKLSELRERLRKYREESRKKPNVDDNLYTYTNSRIGEALLLTSVILGQGAREALGVIDKLNSAGRRLGGGEPLMEDYAASASALLSAYEVTGRINYLDSALRVWDRLFSFKTSQGFVDSARSDEVTMADTPNESPNSIALKTWIKLWIGGKVEFDPSIAKVITSRILTNPPFYAGVAGSLDAILRGAAHVVVIDEGDSKADSLHRSALSIYHPLKLVERVTPDRKDELPPPLRAMLSYGTGSRAYVCVGNTCSLPVYEAEKVRTLLSH